MTIAVSRQNRERSRALTTETTNSCSSSGSE
jgi:hypothetical protein